MLRIIRETDYAIRVILALAKYPPDEIVPSAVIRERMLLPEALSLQIISKLAHHQLINTYPGRNGGIQLAQSPGDITLFEVVNLMEGPLVISECLEDDHLCELSPRCPVQGKWIHLQKVIQYELQAITFKILLEESSYMEKILDQ